MTAVDEQDVWDDAPVPHDAAAEAALLGAVLTSPTAMSDAAALVAPADFYRPAHQEVYAACVALFDRGEPADAVTVGRELGARLHAVGGGPFLHQLVAGWTPAGSAGWYARIVAERAVARRLLAVSTMIGQLARSDADSGDMLAQADRALRDVSGLQASNARPVGEWLEQVLEDLDAAKPQPGVPFGYFDLDSLLHPVTAGRLVIVAARPSVGKSLVGSDIARHCALRLGLPALVVSLEMSGKEYTQRILSAETKIDLGRLHARDLSEPEWERIAHAHARLTAAPLTIDAAEHHTLPTLRALIRRHRPAIVVVDYLQLIETTRTDPRFRQNAVAELSRGLKLLAKSEQVPLIVLAQLNRQPETRTGGRPALADLRESGAIEQDADDVILIHRPDLSDPELRPGEVDLIVAKQRNGPTGQVTLVAQTHYARFVDSATRTAW